MDAYAVDHHLLDSSPSKTASSSGGEIGAYGNGGAPPDSDEELSTTPTLTGALTQSERWTGEVTLTGSVEVNWPYKLIIDAGTVIHMPSSATLTVNNFVRILGTESSPVVFEAAEGATNWSGIYLNSSGAGSTIRYAHISDATYCIRSQGAPDEINNNRLSNCQYGVYVNSGSPDISNNLIIENAYAGIHVNNGNPQITYNTLDQNGNYGVYFSTSVVPTITNNIITRNTTGLYDYYGKYTGGYNNVWGNGTDYSRTSAAEADISSDPLFADDDFHLDDTSPSKTASTSGGEIGRYGGISSVPLPTVASVDSPTKQSILTLSGTKESGLGIGVNSSIVITVNDSESWSATISLQEGENTLRIYAIDEDGNRSENVSLFITKDATSPQITSSSPVDGAALIVAVEEITLQISDAHSSIDYDAALESARVIGENAGLIAGSWSRSSSTLRFTPAESLGKDNYTVTVTLVDEPLANYQTGAITFSIDDGSTGQPAGPELSELVYDGAELADAGVITNPSAISLVANDPNGIDRIELWIDGELFSTDSNGTTNYAFTWDIQDFSDGLHTITFIAYDTLGNSSEQSLDVDIQLAAPPVPGLTSPSRAYETNETTLEVAGYAQKGSIVYVYNNDNEVAGPLTLDNNDKFSATISLTDGANNIQIMASNRGGDSSKTAAVTVTLDSSIPVAPSGLIATIGQSGLVRLNWNLIENNSVNRYYVYRSDSEFDSIATAINVGSTSGQQNSLSDYPGTDDTYYYRVVAENFAGTVGLLSNQVSAKVDSMGPVAEEITYSSSNVVDGVYGPGLLDITLRLNEQAAAVPFLSLSQEYQSPVPVQLTKTGDYQYTGQVEITDAMASGTAYAVFSASDAAGNRGTTVLEGQQITLDLSAPQVTQLSITPADPINNDSGSVNVEVTFTLDSESAATTLNYQLSGEGRTLQPVSVVSSGHNTWAASFVLPNDAGLASAESLNFTLNITDELGNSSGDIPLADPVQVYQGDLIPLAMPTEFAAESVAGGNVKLSWIPTTGAGSYVIYRSAVNSTELTELTRVTASTYTDAPGEDGDYLYAVASVRNANSQEAISGYTTPLAATSDSTAPATPAGLVLSLSSSGVKAQWDVNQEVDLAEYRLYRSATESLDLQSATPVATSDLLTQVVDSHPSTLEHYYALTAVDAVGNESAATSAEYLNFSLLPVADLTFTQSALNKPVLSWQSGSEAEQFNVYLIRNDQALKLTSTPTTAFSYTDTGYGGEARTLAVAEVDENAVEGLIRSVTLPAVDIALDDAVLSRGVFNHLVYTVTNRDSNPLENASLEVVVAGRTHRSAGFTIAAGESLSVPVVIGGYDDLPGADTLSTTLQTVSNNGETAQIIREYDYESIDDSLLLELRTADFTRGATGEVRFSLHNTGEATVDLLASSPVPGVEAVEIMLTDIDGNVVSVESVAAISGNLMQTLANGSQVIRIPAGETFESAAITVNVPLAAPDELVVRLSIDSVYHQLDAPVPLSIEGPTTTRDVTLTDVPYIGQVTAITPLQSNGEPVTISGQAIDVDTDQTIALAALNIVITVDGFERVYEAVTNQQGEFELEFEPMSGESGQYQVAVLHPDINDRPVHGTFTIGKLFATPSDITLSTPRNVQQDMPITLAAAGTDMTNVQLVYRAMSQPLGTLPDGITINLPEATDIAADDSASQSASQVITFTADDSADENGVLIIDVLSDQGGNSAIETIRIAYSLSDAIPNFAFTPGYINTGVQTGNSVTETLQLNNNGLASFTDVSFNLTDTSGEPKPDWVFISSPDSYDEIAVGDTVAIAITAAPNDGVTEGDYEFLLNVASSNAATVTYHVYVAVTSSGEGSMIFTVSDIYTGTEDPYGEIIQGLQGAYFRLQNERVTSIEATGTTDESGAVTFSDLPAGTYKYVVTADNHQSVTGRVSIKPGVTSSINVHMDYNLVSIEWFVQEIALQDKYEIVLTADYETDVPAPVVIMTPESIELPDMQKGDVEYGEIVLTNYGLITAEDIELNVPQDEHYKIEFLEGIPETLDAKQRVTLAYKITALEDIFSGDPNYEPPNDNDNPDDPPSIQDCVFISIKLTVRYTYHCVNGEWRTAAIYSYLSKMVNRCNSPNPPIWTGGQGPGGGGITGPGGGGGSGGSYGGGGPGGGAGGPTLRPAYRPIDKDDCTPDPDKDEPDNPQDPCGNDTDRNVPTNSWVDGVMREYQDAATDIWVKVTGGEISIERRYYNNQWHWQHDRNRLLITVDSASGSVESIERGDVMYEQAVSGSDEVFEKDEFRIIKSVEGYRWQSPQGEWESYDTQGRVTSHGDLSGVISEYGYANQLDTRPNAIFDRNSTQVFWLDYDTNNQLTSVEDVSGRLVTYTYSSGNLKTVTRPDESVLTYNFNGSGLLTSKTDANGNKTTITYNNNDEPVSVLLEDGTGKHFSYGYDENTEERYIRIESTSGRVREVWYDRNLEVQRVLLNDRTIRFEEEDGKTEISSDEKGNVTRTTKNSWDQPTIIVYPDNTKIEIDYSQKFNLVERVIDQRGVITEVDYDESGNAITKTEAVGLMSERQTSYEYNQNNQLIRMTIEADNNTAEASTYYEYDDFGNVVLLTDPEGHQIQYLDHDVMGNATRVIDAKGNEWTLEYDAMGRLLSVTDPLSHQTTYEYDGNGNQTAVVDALSERTEYRFDFRDQITLITDPLSNTRAIEYNSDGLPTILSDESGKIVVNTYDSEERLLTTQVGSEENGYTTSYQYDESQDSFALSSMPVQIDYPTYSARLYYDRMQRVVTTTDILSEDQLESTYIEYDEAGNRIALIDKANRTTSYSYDGLNRLIAETDADGNITQYQYDDRNNLIALTDANGGITRFSYDGNNRLLTETRPMGEVTTYTYDENGNTQSKVDAKGQRIEFQYDAANRMVTELRYANTETDTPDVRIDYTYDAEGRLTSYDDSITQGTFSYDELGRKIHEEINYGEFTASHGYSFYGNSNKESFTTTTGAQYDYQYDSANRLQAITLPNAQRVTYNSYTWMAPDKVTYPGGNTTKYLYDPLLRISAITSTDFTQNTILNYTYQYDVVGNIEQKATEHGVYSYGYDALDRLTSAVNPTLEDEAYTYDPLGNRLTSAATNSTWQYNLNNQLLGYDSTTFSYDENGSLNNQMENGVYREYRYNIDNRLTNVIENNQELASYYHDPLGRRLWQQVNGVKTYYQYADEGLIAELDEQGRVIKSYGFRPDSLWTTAPIYQEINNEYFWYLNDHLGTPQKLITQLGNQSWAAQMTAFGVTNVVTEQITNNLRLPGQYAHSETGQYYNYQRNYSPLPGRYNEIDPFGLNGGINFYLYARNNPQVFIDPTGEFVPALVGLIGAYGRGVGLNLALQALDNLLNGRPVFNPDCYDWPEALKAGIPPAFAAPFKKISPIAGYGAQQAMGGIVNNL